MTLPPLSRRNLTALIALVVAGVLLVVFRHAVEDILSGRPVSFSLPVSFTTQAPTGKWENNENCEEASAVMANAYLTGYTEDRLTAATTQESINKLVTWEREHFGHADNNGVDEISDMIEGVFFLHTEKIDDFTEADLKHELLQHHVLILPISMKRLGNPEYPDDGVQVYHVLVIRGYTTRGFLVNDPGLSSGKNNLYSFRTLKNAASDWDSEHHTIVSGAAVLSVSK